MAYTNATFYIDLENGNDAARTALTAVAVANNGAGLVRCTKAGHNLVSGAVVDVPATYTGAWMLTVLDANTFDLIGSTYGSATAITVTPRGGSSKADAWKTYASGATSSRIAAGDTVRIMASPDPVLLGNATWTDLGKTIALASPAIANISHCAGSWTPSTNVTSTATQTTRKIGTHATSVAIAAGFTTGKAAYKALPEPATVVSRASNLLGPGSLTMIQNAHVYDASIAVALPFPVTFNGTSYTTVYVGSNGYLTFGAGSAVNSGINLLNPALPAILINAGDRSYQRVYTGSEDGNATFRIRYEGSNGAATPGFSTIFWEVTFSAASPTTLKLDIGDNVSAGTGLSGLSSGTGDLLGEFSSGTANIGYTFTFPLGTGYALDLSGHQQVSFWLWSSINLAAGAVSLRLCSDAAGDTTVNTVPLPEYTSTQNWHICTVDLAAALGTSIKSVALYCEVDTGAATLYLNNLIACKAKGSAGALTLSTVIGKERNLSWLPSTVYAAGAVRRPTQVNRTGYCYKVTAGGGGSSGATEPVWPMVEGLSVADGALTWTYEYVEDTWYGIQSIDGTTVALDNDIAATPIETRGYAGDTETVPTYIREVIVRPSAGSYSETSPQNVIQASGTATNELTYSGGWDRTNMSALTGETWTDGRNGQGGGISTSNRLGIVIRNLHNVRFTAPINIASSRAKVLYCSANNSGGVKAINSITEFIGLAMCNNYAQSMAASGSSKIRGRAWLVNSTRMGYSQIIGTAGNPADIVDLVLRNNDSSNYIGQTSVAAPSLRVTNLISANNTSPPVNIGLGGAVLVNARISEVVPINEEGATAVFAYLYSHKYGGVEGSHLITSYGGTILSATDQRHTASGISWKFRPTNVTRDSGRPLAMPIAKIACAAGVAVNVRIWARRDNVNIQGMLRIRGWQLKGVAGDREALCAPAINTWVQSDVLTFTPTETGVIEVEFLVWDGVGTTNNFWIDDLEIT